jgi:hypothetical protein
VHQEALPELVLRSLQPSWPARADGVGLCSALRSYGRAVLAKQNWFCVVRRAKQNGRLSTVSSHYLARRAWLAARSVLRSLDGGGSSLGCSWSYKGEGW